MMLDTYEKYGYYKESQYTITLKGIDGSKQIAEIMDKLRQNPPKAFGERQVLKFRDYQTDRIVDMATGEEGKTGLPKSNVLYFELEDDAWCCIRPSGTEPKIKFYIGVRGRDEEEAVTRLRWITKAVEELAD